MTSNSDIEFLSLLGGDGVTSSLARKSVPDRYDGYKSAAKSIHAEWVKKLKKMKNTQKSSSLKSKLPTTEQIEKVIHIIETNCHSISRDDVNIQNENEKEQEIYIWGSEFDNEDIDILGVFKLASFMEHSCFPNSTVQLSIHNQKLRLTLRATRFIESGDLITISYQENEYEPTSIRRKRLSRRGFECCCVLCEPRKWNSGIRDWCRIVKCGNECGGVMAPLGEGKYKQYVFVFLMYVLFKYNLYFQEFQTPTGYVINATNPLHLYI